MPTAVVAVVAPMMAVAAITMAVIHHGWWGVIRWGGVIHRAGRRVINGGWGGVINGGWRVVAIAGPNHHARYANANRPVNVTGLGRPCTGQQCQRHASRSGHGIDRTGFRHGNLLLREGSQPNGLTSPVHNAPSSLKDGIKVSLRCVWTYTHLFLCVKLHETAA